MRTDDLDSWPDAEETVHYGQPPIIADQDVKEDDANQCSGC